MRTWLSKEKIIMHMNRSISLKVAALLFIFFLSSGKSEAQTMSDYCIVPPYVIQNVPASVMVVVDNSGSMFNFAYRDGFNKGKPVIV